MSSRHPGPSSGLGVRRARFRAWPLGRLDLAVVAALAALLMLLLVSAANVSPVRALAWSIGIASLAGVAHEWSRGRLFSLAFITYVFTLTVFCIRPLYVWGNRSQLQFHEFPKNANAELKNLNSLELANFVTNRFSGNLERAMTFALLLGAVFLGCFLIGLSIGSRHLSAKLPRLFGSRPDPTKLAKVVGVLLIVGFGTQLAQRVGVGGSLFAKTSFEASMLIRSALIGLLLWAAFGRLRGLFGVAFAVTTIAFVVLRASGGSRTEALLPILAIFVVIHVARRPIRRRELAVLILGGIMVTNAVLTTRVVAKTQPAATALVEGLKSSLDPSVAQGDNSLFDDFLLLTSIVPDEIPFQHGGRIVAGIKSAVPSVFYPGKPPQNEITFRRLVWGELYEGGRPYSHLGEFWFDFGWAGAIVGSLLMGLLAARFRDVGQPLVLGGDPSAAVLAGILVPNFYVVIDGTYTIFLSALISFTVPLAVAMLALRRVSSHSPRLA